jgi:hypothetical protein
MSSAKFLNCCYADQYRFSRSKREWIYSTSYQYKCLNKPGLPIANPGAATALNLSFFEAIQKPTKEFLTSLLNENDFQGWYCHHYRNKPDQHLLTLMDLRVIHSIGHRKETSRSPMFRYHNSDYCDLVYEFEVIITKGTTQTSSPMGSMAIMYEALRMIKMPQENNPGSQGRVVGEIEDAPAASTPAPAS